MNGGYKKVTITCPKCNGSKKIIIPENIFLKAQNKGIVNIEIPEGLVCEHSFQAFVDKQSKVRGYSEADYICY